MEKNNKTIASEQEEYEEGINWPVVLPILIGMVISVIMLYVAFS